MSSFDWLTAEPSQEEVVIMVCCQDIRDAATELEVDRRTRKLLEDFSDIGIL